MSEATPLSLGNALSRNIANRNGLALHAQDVARSAHDDRFRKSLDGLLDEALQAGKSVSFKSASYAQHETSTWHAHEKALAQSELATHQNHFNGFQSHASLRLAFQALPDSTVDVLNAQVLHSNHALQPSHVQHVAGSVASVVANYNAQLVNQSEGQSGVTTRWHDVQHQSNQNQTLQHAYEPQHVHVVKQPDGYVVYIRDASVQGDAMRSAWFSSTFKRIKNVLNAFLNGSKQPQLAANNDAALKSIWLNGKAMQSNEPVHHKHETGVFSK